MSWKGSLEITYSFFQRLFYFHLQTLSRDVETESAVALSHEGEGAARSAAHGGRSGEAERKELGKASCGCGLATSHRPPAGYSAAVDAMSSIGPWDLLRFLQIYPRASQTQDCMRTGTCSLDIVRDVGPLPWVGSCVCPQMDCAPSLQHLSKVLEVQGPPRSTNDGHGQ